MTLTLELAVSNRLIANRDSSCDTKATRAEIGERTVVAIPVHVNREGFVVFPVLQISCIIMTTREREQARTVGHASRKGGKRE